MTNPHTQKAPVIRHYEKRGPEIRITIDREPDGEMCDLSGEPVSMRATEYTHGPCGCIVLGCKSRLYCMRCGYWWWSDARNAAA